MSLLPDDPFIRDLLILLGASLAGVVGGALAARGVDAGRRLDPAVRRKRLLVGFSTWFFVAFLIGAFLVGCSYRLGCR